MFFQQPPPHPPTEPVICIHETLGRGPEWLCDDYVEARPVTVGLFINDESFRLLLFFFSHTLLLNFFYINETESKLVSPPPSGYGISDPKSQIPCLFFIPIKACCGRPNCAAVYKTNLPTMTPTMKKSTMRATVRALNPSSFFMPTEECWDDIMLLFLIRSPSSSWDWARTESV